MFFVRNPDHPSSTKMSNLAIVYVMLPPGLVGSTNTVRLHRSGLYLFYYQSDYVSGLPVGPLTSSSLGEDLYTSYTLSRPGTEKNLFVEVGVVNNVPTDVWIYSMYDPSVYPGIPPDEGYLYKYIPGKYYKINPEISSRVIDPGKVYFSPPAPFGTTAGLNFWFLQKEVKTGDILEPTFNFIFGMDSDGYITSLTYNAACPLGSNPGAINCGFPTGVLDPSVPVHPDPPHPPGFGGPVDLVHPDPPHPPGHGFLRK